jgi:predicted alpha/beta-fold hydrolase
VVGSAVNCDAGPARKAAFEPTRALSNRHVQTVLRLLLRQAPDVPLRAVSIPTPDGDVLEAYLDSAADSAPEAAPVVLIVHGLEGSHLSPYVRTLRRLVQARGWSSVSMVHRSCGGRLNLAPRLYHTGETQDLATVVRWIVERWPRRDLLVVGYSLGGNQVAKWLGSHGDALPTSVRAAAAVSPPFDLTLTAPQIDAALFGIYRRKFLRTLIPKALAKARQYPDLLDPTRLASIRTLRDFDGAVTATLHGFVDADDYYRHSGCGQYLSGVRRPLLLVASADDPFTPGETIPEALCRGHRWLHGLFTRQGGHVGFVAGTPLQPSYWSELELLRFFDSILAN